LATLLPPPKFQFVNSAGQPYGGGSLTFYLTGTSTLEDTYTTSGLSVANSNPLTLNSAGWPATDIYLSPDTKYKVVLKDSSGTEVWTVDPVSTTDFAVVPLWTSNAGDPNGSVAGTASSSGVLPSMVWDRTNSIIYVCTTTGDAASAVWTAINASSATPVVTAPQGYLTMTSATPIIVTEVTAGTAVYYTPLVGNLVPIYNGSSMIPTTFAELTLTLAAQHLASQIYDVFVFSNSGVVTLATGPAWATPTAGAGDRGTGASTTELTRLNGYWVNNVQITGRNGANTYTIAANRATYLGSIYMDGTNGQLTCHRAWGQSRKWGVWNAYNRQPLYLKAGDSTATWSYNTNTTRASNDASTNSLTVFSGLAEEWYDLEFTQTVVLITGNNLAIANTGIGWNSTTTASGRLGDVRGQGGSTETHGNNAYARHKQVPSLGINVVTALENAADPASSSMTWHGGEEDMMLSAHWRG
jgi:hypothetical protein